ncbi:ATP-binding protein [Jinshanibacter sp. LJY008]|uniref:histidine kinase n=1 Tax=Limnobaculum eriocheiris TaxID=2897391 RepID=A0A9X1MXS0_9GAMM|nr:ATP-binding protein [Limnobaculum eriocheiris]
MDSARSSNESTGLGLAPVKSIVALHNDTIWVESEVGHGSRFVMSFPSV